MLGDDIAVRRVLGGVAGGPVVRRGGLVLVGDRTVLLRPLVEAQVLQVRGDLAVNVALVLMPVGDVLQVAADGRADRLRRSVGRAGVLAPGVAGVERSRPCGRRPRPT